MSKLLNNKIVLGIVSLAVCVLGGCSSMEISGPAPEKVYAENMMVDASDIGEGWSQVDKVVYACSRYGAPDSIEVADAKTKFFGEDPVALLKSRGGPFHICAATGYSLPGSDKIDVRLRYYYVDYPAVGVKDNDKLPGGRVKEWNFGSDGLAFGAAEQEAEVLGESVSAKDRAEAKAADREKAEEKTAGADTKETEENTGIKEEVVSADKPEVEVKTEGALVEKKSDDKTAESPADKSEGNAPVYLAANGLLVELTRSGSVGDEQFAQVTKLLREKMGPVLAAERKMRDELAEGRRRAYGKTALEEQENKELDIYWKLLDLGFGTICRKKF